MATPRPQLTLPEEILLLVLKDEEGTVEFGTSYHCALGGAVLAELLLREAVRSEEVKGKPCAVPADTTSSGDPVLDEALSMIADSDKPRKLQDWVSKLANIKELKHEVAASLCRKGVLREDEDKVLLIFKRRIYPEVDPVPEQELRERIERAIFEDGEEVDPRTAVLISLAHATDLLRFCFDKKELKPRKERIERVINGELAGKATREAVAAMRAAVMVAVIIPAVVSTTVITSN